MNSGVLKILMGVLAAFILGGHIKMIIQGCGLDIEIYRPIVMGVFMVFFLISGFNELKNKNE